MSKNACLSQPLQPALKPHVYGRWNIARSYDIGISFQVLKNDNLLAKILQRRAKSPEIYQRVGEMVYAPFFCHTYTLTGYRGLTRH